MEELEGRVMLDGITDAVTLDLSVVNHLLGTVPALYRLDVSAGQKYLILDQHDTEQIHLLDAQKHEISVMEDWDFVARGEWVPETSGTYYLSIENGWGSADYNVIVRPGT